MKCKQFMQKYIQMDNNQGLTVTMEQHLGSCKNCRKEVHDLGIAFKTMQKINPFPVKENISERIMEILLEPENNYQRDFSLLNWVFVGIVILASILLVPFSDSLIWLQEHFGRKITLPLNLVLGMVITLYAATFVITHLERLNRYASVYLFSSCNRLVARLWGKK